MVAFFMVARISRGENHKIVRADLEGYAFFWFTSVTHSLTSCNLTSEAGREYLKL
jgi:hypothetical protein